MTITTSTRFQPSQHLFRLQNRPNEGPPTAREGEERQIQQAMLKTSASLRSSCVFRGRPAWNRGDSCDEEAGLSARQEVETGVLRTGRIRSVPPAAATVDSPQKSAGGDSTMSRICRIRKQLRMRTYSSLATAVYPTRAASETS